MRDDPENGSQGSAEHWMLSSPKACEGDPIEQRRIWQRLAFFRPWCEGAHVQFPHSSPGGAQFVEVVANRVEPKANRPLGPGPHGEGAAGTQDRDPDSNERHLLLDFTWAWLSSHPDASANIGAANAEFVVAVEPGRFTSEPAARRRVEALDAPGVRWFSQQAEPPYTIRPGRDPKACRWFAARSVQPQPEWPSVAIAIPTRYAGKDLAVAVESLLTYYPGRLDVAIVANGCEPDELRTIEPLLDLAPGRVQIACLSENRGFAEGANAGLEALVRTAPADLFGVCNDDVELAPDCLAEMSQAFLELERLGHRPGALGPVSNDVHGPQRVELPSPALAESWDYVAWLRRSGHQSVRQTVQVRGLLLLWSPACLEAVGGFDRRFEIGNYEDDDHNVRTRLAGFTLWIADGAYVHHHGSRTFRRLRLDYEELSRRNGDRFLQKWGVGNYEDAFRLERCPSGVALYEPLAPAPADSNHVSHREEPSPPLITPASERAA